MAVADTYCLVALMRRKFGGGGGFSGAPVSGQPSDQLVLRKRTAGQKYSVPVPDLAARLIIQIKRSN